ncbi:hypothetical protein DICPUDRAFT_146595 [Dictyostelium purpureum]|uniref:Uncharacterized protein n=1 Tax=Dictyostelium purpureum TaxID=5786 RepID=F0Z6D2_DICPU|nr:uncharacterized protein DICPUDRAFT_146595 [Dictyostelium purpureum]EGC40423.1 hypothetical protein DICPUDRAFT_146595 [Dictyostelium purpureum]|eukprot:XP_003282970.1 hypothetical protein DICPUDRAFT_146595 [Dictyostelium purpureum]
MISVWIKSSKSFNPSEQLCKPVTNVNTSSQSVKEDTTNSEAQTYTDQPTKAPPIIPLIFKK